MVQGCLLLVLTSTIGGKVLHCNAG